jgi:hypothetical protein
MKKLQVLRFAAEPHHSFDAGPVVPAAVKEHEFTGRGQMRDVALEIPLCLFFLSGSAKGNYPANAWIQGLGNALDGAALPGGVAAFEEYYYLEAPMSDPFLQLDQLNLQRSQFRLVVAIRS